jgi:predicted NBD/HSP70 family sugar kinase
MRVLAIDMGGTFIKYAICEVNMNNGDIKFLKKDRFRTTTEENPYGTEVVEDMAKFVSKILKKHPEVKCICGSIGGVIDDEKYQVLSSHHKFQDYHMVNIKHIFDKYTKLPIYIMNDVKAGGLGELRYGSLKKYHKHANAIFMAIGTGIAMVSIINGKLHLGYEYAAGEIAGMVINNHYYENHYALPYLIKRCQALDPDLITAEDCLRAAKKHKQIKNMIDA